MPVTGQVVGDRYKIEKRIGEGGMAVVYMARDTLLDRLVAVKILRDQFAGDEEFVQRFRREARSAARLSHPNVVHIFDVGEWDGTHYIVMEYVDGENLKEILRRGGALPAERVATIARGVAQALHHAHQHGLVHRDIKPHNILITSDGQVKVTDFGIARATSSSTLTQTGTVLGSVHYLSPEQAQGRPAGESSDIYSLGVLMYEMVTGRVPFRGESPIAVALKHLNDPPDRPSRRVRDVPQPLEDVILKAMEKDPDDRFATAAELFNALNGFSPESSVTSWGGLAPSARAGMSEGGDTERYGPDGWDPATARMTAMPEWEGEASGDDAEEAGAEGDEREEDEEGAAPRRRWGRIGLWAAAILVGLIWGAQSLLTYLFPPDVNVPDVTGLNLPEARRTLDERGLQLVVDEQLTSEDVPEGLIMNQDPAADRSVKAGRSVHVIVSTGPEFVDAPDVVGLSLDEARLAILNAGLTLGEVSEAVDPNVPPNRVIAQNPGAEAPQPKGSGVDLVVSRGDRPIPTLFLPDFRGEPFDGARAWLEANGLRVGNLYPTPPPPDPVVEEQNPLPHTEVEVGWEVNFVLRPDGERLSEGGGIQGDRPPIAGGESDARAPADRAPVPTESRPGAPPASESQLADAGDREDDGGRVEEPPREQLSPPDVPASDDSWRGDDPWREVSLSVNVPPGPPQEVLVLLIDDLVGSEIVYQDRHEGGDQLNVAVQGWGENARVQVFIDTVLWLDESFSDLNR